MSHDGKRPVILEDLLRLKRAERPAPEFWDQFDRQLRAKQLAALVQRRPWWRDLPHLFPLVRRYPLPLGAAVALAITFVTLREYRATALVPAPAANRPSPAVVVDIPSESKSIADASRPPATPTLGSAPESAPSTDVAVADLETAAPTSSAAGSEPVIPRFAGMLDASPATAESSPSARSIAANLAAAEAIGTRVLLGKSATFEVARPAMARAATVEPLQQMTSPLEVRLARYRSPLVASIGNETPDHTGERIARRISDDRLYDQISRIGARGDRVQVRF